MLQCTLQSQLARLKPLAIGGIRTLFDPDRLGPVKVLCNEAKETLKMLDELGKHWSCGDRSIGIAAELLTKKKIIAVPTDTIYGLTGLAQDSNSIARLYKIKKRDESKPLAICVCDVCDIKTWGHVEHLPDGLLEDLLPGPVTVVVKRTELLNPELNPGVENIGIRIPDDNFIRKLVKMVNEPLALTSANESNKQSTVHPLEFEALWPEIDGIFYKQCSLPKSYQSIARKGSSVIDLSVEKEYKVIRKGTGFRETLAILKARGFQKRTDSNKTEHAYVQAVNQ